MFYTKDHKTLDMFEPFPQFGPKRRRLLDSSWAGLFRKEILPQLPVQKLMKHFHEYQGRPTKELYAMVGALILQQLHDLSDAQTAEQVAFNLQWHYALNITGTGDGETYVSDRTLWTLRHLLMSDKLGEELFQAVTGRLAELFEVDTSHQRLDSTHIFSNMRHLGRVRLFAVTIRKFLVNLRRHHRDLFDQVGEKLTGKYFSRGSEVFSFVKPSETARTLQSLAQEAWELLERFRQHEAVVQMSSYGLVARLVREQCIVQSGAEGPAVRVKPNKEVASDSLQNPSDPDAGYSGHKGQGYTGQIMESYVPEPAAGEPAAAPKEAALSLITHVEVHPAHVGDASALVPAIEAAREQNLAPQTVVADTLYGSDDNVAEAATRGVELVSPAMGAPTEGKIGLEDFTIDKDGNVLSCPQGHKPAETSRSQSKHRARFPLELCAECPRQLSCPVRWNAKGYVLRFKDKALRLARRRAGQNTEAFREVYRYRAGIEATMSHLKHLLGAGRLRVRGLPAVRLSIFLKAAALNILRAVSAVARRKDRARLSASHEIAAAGIFCAFLRAAVAARAALRLMFRLSHAHVAPNWR